MRILYLGKFEIDYRTERYVSYALEQLGCRVEQIHVGPDICEGNVKRMIHTSRPSFILFSKSSLPWFGNLITYCRRIKIPTVTWIWDLYFGYRPERPAQLWADLLFTTDGGHQDEWKELGVNHHVLRQGIHKPDARMLNQRNEIEVCFVGTKHKHSTHRTQLLKWLEQQYGADFQLVQRSRGMQLNKMMAKTKVVVGDSFPSPNYWSNRIYEMLGRGGFLLHPETPGLEQEFTDGVHYVSYRRGDYDQLHQLIEHYRNNDRERLAIAKAGHEHTKERYSYEDRCRVLIEHLRPLT